MEVYTIGHSTRTQDELIALLKEAGVGSLVDVRSYPRSRTNPQFNSDVLAGALERAGTDRPAEGVAATVPAGRAV